MNQTRIQRVSADEYKVCPECREEFTLVVDTCADCGVVLVSPDALPAEVEAEAFPDVDQLVCIRVGPIPWTRALSDGLTQAGVAHRVEPDQRSEAEGGVDPRRFDGQTLFGTWVMPEDEEPARALDAVLFAHFEPDAAGAADGSEACPACDESLAADVVECPGCGLSLG
jgi:hypothetical protein